MEYQSGVFLGGSGVDFQFDMRTTLQDGLLFFAHGGKGSYWLVYMRGGRLLVSMAVDTLVTHVVHRSDNVELCDGDWHQIQ